MQLMTAPVTLRGRVTAADAHLLIVQDEHGVGHAVAGNPHKVQIDALGTLRCEHPEARFPVFTFTPDETRG